MSHPSLPLTGPRSVMLRAISVGAAGSATSPTRMDSIWNGYPPRLRRHAIVPSSRLSWRLLISARVTQEQEWGEDPRALGLDFGFGCNRQGVPIRVWRWDACRFPRP